MRMSMKYEKRERQTDNLKILVIMNVEMWR